MSAFEVSKAHIDALVTAALDICALRHGSPLRWYFPAIDRGSDTMATLSEKRRVARRESAGRIGAMLWAENVRSVNHRYSADDWECPYVYTRRTHPLSAVQVLKAIACYEYQSCEHHEWPESEAKQFCDALRLAYIGQLPGYDEADWEI